MARGTADAAIPPVAQNRRASDQPVVATGPIEAQIAAARAEFAAWAATGAALLDRLHGLAHDLKRK